MHDGTKMLLLFENGSPSAVSPPPCAGVRGRDRDSAGARALSPSFPFEGEPLSRMGSKGGPEVERAKTLGPHAQARKEESRLLSELFLRAKEDDPRTSLDGLSDAAPRGYNVRLWITREQWWIWAGPIYYPDGTVVGLPDWYHFHTCSECFDIYRCDLDACDRRKGWSFQLPCGGCQIAALNRRLLPSLFSKGGLLTRTQEN
jgi:hypothetical protein